MLDIEDVRRRMHVTTGLAGTVIVAEQNATAALEVMSRFAANPKWLVYLPPTMSPSETSSLENFLEHPAEAFAYFRQQGVDRVIVEEKHMGSRAVVVLGRSEAVIRERFGIDGEGIGTILTRTGRRFFEDPTLGQGLLARLAEAMTETKLWDELNSDWVVLDAELLPWSAKAQQLIRSTYAPVGIAGQAALDALTESLAQAQAGRPDDADLAALVAKTQERREALGRYAATYPRYGWPTETIEDYKLAPFHLLASEGAVHHTQSHLLHMAHLHRLCAADPGVLRATAYRHFDPADATEGGDATQWWLDLTEGGGEGMVIKPVDFTVRNAKGLVQPALKCRGPEYLRMIYGPEYRMPENLTRLRVRGLTTKRTLARREYALGIEALTRFVAREPLRRVHECVFAVLALESEPVDPRL